MKTIINNSKKKVALSCVAIVALCVFGHATTASASRVAERILNAWSRTGEYSDGTGSQFIRLRVTYYAAEYIAALIRAEAERNLWTHDEEENYKYYLLRALNLDETIAFHIAFDVTGVAMHLQPFDRHLRLHVGGTVLAPVDYDRRFNFRLQGQRDGMVWFPRFDPDTGRDLLEGARELRLTISGAISQATISSGDLRFVWDITRDDPSVLTTGPAVARLELERLNRRLDRLMADKRNLEEQLHSVDMELATINARVGELQRQ